MMRTATMRWGVLGALGVLLAGAPAWSCGPDFPSAVFVLPHGPGGDYAAYAKGRLGVPQPEYFTRNLVVAFDWMTGRGLSAEEQKQAAAVQQFYETGGSYMSPEDLRKNASGLASWTAARGRFGVIPGEEPVGEIAMERHVPGDDYETFQNCLDDAFANAAKTLDALAAAHGMKDPAAADWVRGQDAVFTNCGDGKAPQYFGPGQAPPAPPQPRMPVAAGTSAPQWLQKDRAYQMAAAKFYALDFDGAAKAFGQIAADKASPWAEIAPYLVARSHVRAATLEYRRPFDDSNAAKVKVAEDARLTEWKTAHEQLAGLSGKGAWGNAARALQDFVDARYMPDAQAGVLAERLHGKPGDTNFRQALIDLTYLRTNPGDASAPLPPHGARKDAAGLLEWMDAVGLVKGVDPVARWRAENSEAWLFAALTAAKPGDAAVPELLRAAAVVKPDSRAYVAIAYHRLRLMPADAAMRGELEALLPRVRSRETLSTVNLFTELGAKSAPGMKDWLRAAGRIPVGEEDGSGVSENIRMGTDDAADPKSPSTENICGTPVKPNTTELFDEDGAFALNHFFPLAKLAEAAESGVLPQNLQFQVAQAAWVRAVMLDRPEVARRMTPLLTGCRPAWKQVLPAYDAAKTAEERNVLGLLALMRFASTEPSVRSGEERRGGFASYDEFRQNWWCTAVPPAGETVDDMPNALQSPRSKNARLPMPLFLTKEDRMTAAAEIAKIERIPSASDYLGNAALEWWRAHPRDAQTAEVLGQSFRVVRNACRDDKRTPLLEHALFDALHKDYPESPWSKKYQTWE